MQDDDKVWGEGNTDRCCAGLGAGGVGGLLKLLSDNEPSFGVPRTWVLALRPPRAISVISVQNLMPKVSLIKESRGK